MSLERNSLEHPQYVPQGTFWFPRKSQGYCIQNSFVRILLAISQEGPARTLAEGTFRVNTKDSSHRIWDVGTRLGRPWDVVCCLGTLFSFHQDDCPQLTDPLTSIIACGRSAIHFRMPSTVAGPHTADYHGCERERVSLELLMLYAVYTK